MSPLIGPSPTRGEGSKHQPRSVPSPSGRGPGKVICWSRATLFPAPTYIPIFFLVTLVGIASSGLSGQ
ncbi:hypothetical protein H2136_07860 [Aeromonas hydrophila]|uniref:Uncharacterized protein n=1 Tax=Aeromonas hydrophila TaxID=644 RepID=A0A926FK25_AERHY|nr:hypothetical protein [Aeromonas hydrophila]